MPGIRGKTGEREFSNGRTDGTARVDFLARRERARRSLHKSSLSTSCGQLGRARSVVFDRVFVHDGVRSPVEREAPTWKVCGFDFGKETRLEPEAPRSRMRVPCASSTETS